MKIVWDEPKRLANLAKHGFDFADVVFFHWQSAVIKPARPDSDGRPRLKAVGYFDNRRRGGDLRHPRHGSDVRHQLQAGKRPGKKGSAMTGKTLKKESEPGHGYAKEDWDAVDSPELTEEELAQFRPARDVLPPEFFKGIEEVRRARGRPSVESPKQVVSIRLDPDVIAKFKATGKGWQSRINDILKKARVG